MPTKNLSALSWRIVSRLLFALALSLPLATLSQSQLAGPYLGQTNWKTYFQAKVIEAEVLSVYNTTLPEEGEDVESYVVSDVSPSLLFDQDPQISKEEWDRRTRKNSYIVAGSLVALGAVLISVNEDFNDVRQRYLPNFSDDIDDYIQFAPIAAIYVMNLAGYKGRHNIGRYSLNLVTTGILMAVVVQSLKAITNVERPDGSENTSWPSGHTATAFMAAHMFHKEYGHRSPYLSIAGYAVATATGVLRQLNNRHWFSDTVAGAGFGIGLTEFGYQLSDWIFKDYGVNDYEVEIKEPNREKPGYFSSKLGYAMLSGGLSDREQDIYGDDGFQINLDGAYMFNKYIGVGVTWSFSSFPLKESSELPIEFDNIESTAIGLTSFAIGPYFGYSLSDSWLLSGKVQVGYATSTEASFKVDTDTEDEVLIAETKEGDDISFVAGLMINKTFSKRLGVGLFGEYTSSTPKVDSTVLTGVEENGDLMYETFTDPLDFKFFSVGIALNVMLW